MDKCIPITKAYHVSRRPIMYHGRMTVPDMIPKPSTYSDDLRFKAMRDLRRQRENQNLSRNQTQNSTKDHTFSSPTIYLSKIILKSIQNLFLFRVMSIAISSSLSSVYSLTLSLTACGYYWKLQLYTWIWFGMINHPGKDYSGDSCTNIM